MKKSATVLRGAGDVSIDKIDIITSSGFHQDVTAQVITIQYYEDLFSPFITGSLILKESFDYINLFPFIGEEYLDLEINTPTLGVPPIKGKYYIYKMTNREFLGDKSLTYQLHFISVEAVADVNKKVSRVFANRVSDLVEPFVKDKVFGLESEKRVVVEPTSNNLKYISNYWTPTQNLTHLTDHCANANKSPSYLFYENRDGFYFVSLEKLFSSAVYQEFKFDKYTRDIVGPDNRAVKNIKEDYKRIIDISVGVGFDYIDRIKTGALSSRQISFDVTKKVYSSKSYISFDRFPSQKHLNPNPLNSDNVKFKSNSKIFILNRNYSNFNGFADVTNFKYNQERASLMKMVNSSKINITVPGRVDYTVGQKVNLDLLKIQPLSKRDKDTVDKIYSGNYLISAINHYINRETHEAHMELIKDSSLMNMTKGR